MIEPVQRETLPIDRDEVAFWFSEIEASKEFRTKEFLEPIKYNKLIRYIEGYQVPNLDNIDYAQLNTMCIINEMHPAIYSIIMSTYNKNPSTIVKATHPEAEKKIAPLMEYVMSPESANFEPYPLSALMEAAIKAFMKKTNFKVNNQMALFDMIVAGFAIVEVNHRVEQPKAYKDKPKDDRNIIDKSTDAIINTIFGKDKQEVEKKVRAEIEPIEEDKRFHASFVKRWNPTKILFDYEADVFTESRYIAKEIDMRFSDFCNMYPEHKDKISQDSLRSMEYARHGLKENRSTIRLYELEIKRPDVNRKLVLAEGVQDAIDYYENPIITNDFNLKYGSIDKYGKIYPMSRAAMMKKAQDQLNHYATIEMEHADRQMQKIAVYTDGLTESGKASLTDNDIYGIVEKTTPNAVFERVPQGNVTAENQNLQSKMTEAINKIGSVNELVKSGKSDSEFATQDAIKQQSYNISISGYQDALEDLINEELDAGKDIIMQLWEGDDFLQITGLPGGNQWYSPAMGPLYELLLGDYAVTANIITAQRTNPVKERNDAIELLRILLEPSTQQFLMQRNKQLDVQIIENVIKQYNMNPEALIKEIQTQSLPPEQQMNPILANAGVGAAG